MSELCRNPGARAAGGWPHFCLDLGLHHTLFQGSDGSTFSEMCLHPSPAGVKMQLPRMDPRLPVVLEQEPLVAPVCLTPLNHHVHGRLRHTRASSPPRGTGAWHRQAGRASPSRAAAGWQQSSQEEVTGLGPQLPGRISALTPDCPLCERNSAILGGAHQSATGRKEGGGILECGAAVGPRP